MMSSASYHYVHDSSYNLLASTRHGSQGDHLSPHTSTRLFPNPCNNQSVPAALTGNAFDRAGNMLHTPTLPRLSWDVTNMMQTTTQAANALGQANREFYTYTASQSRTRKVSETTNGSGTVIEITVSLYFGMVEKRSTYKGADLSYDGVGVYDQGQRTSPEKTETDLRITDMTGDGHRQVARQRRTVAHKERETTVEFFASNHIDSDQLRLSVIGEIVSYQNYRPFGTVAWQYGTTRANHYGYSGQETDATGLSYYGSRYYCPELRRWLSCDKAGDPDQTLNRYAFVRGNPITFRDVRGFMTDTDIVILCLAILLFLVGVGCCGWNIRRIYRNTLCPWNRQVPIRGEWYSYDKEDGNTCVMFYHGDDKENQRIINNSFGDGKEILGSLIEALNNKLSPELKEILTEGFGPDYDTILPRIRSNFRKIHNAISKGNVTLSSYGSHLTQKEDPTSVIDGVTVGISTRLSRGTWRVAETKRYASLKQIEDFNSKKVKTSVPLEYYRHTDDYLFFIFVHELVHNSKACNIGPHQYDYSNRKWQNVKDRSDGGLTRLGEVLMNDLDSKKTVKNPDSYAYVATAWKRAKRGPCNSVAPSGDVAETWSRIQNNAPIVKSTISLEVEEKEDIDNDPDVNIVYSRGKR